MKELSIEEKAERYDKALERARKLQENSNGMILKKWLWDIFPELKESEDERIRKEIIQFFKEKDEEDFEEWVPKVEILAWLEKQVPACLSHDDEIMIRQLTEYFTTGKGLQNTNDTVVEWLTDVKRKLEKQGKQKSIDDLTQQEAMDIAVAKCFEQGEQKLNNKIQIGKKYKCIASPRYTAFMIGQVYQPNDKFLCSLMNFCSDCFEPFDVIKPQGKTAQETIKEEKVDNANKVEPKFHLNEWVVTGKNDVVQIKAVNNGYYTIDNGMDFGMSYVDKYWHKWTIQDAKDGDILVTMDDERSFIYKGCLDSNHPDSPVAYCGINSEEYFQIGGDKFAIWWTDRNVQPATKEQYDTLMKAIADAGYVFDFEKKELKKIEQPHAWSKEDEKRTEQICDDLKCAYENFRSGKNVKGLHFEEIIKSNIDWLKSLKDRVQPKQEWSEEDKEVINLLLELVYEQDKISPRIPSNEKKMMLSWLKSLKDRYTWKPNNKQMNALDSTLQYNKVSHNSFEHLNSLFNNLKKLK